MTRFKTASNTNTLHKIKTVKEKKLEKRIFSKVCSKQNRAL